VSLQFCPNDLAFAAGPYAQGGMPPMKSAVLRANKSQSSMRAILTLLVISAFINYIDRGNLSVAAPLISD